VEPKYFDFDPNPEVAQVNNVDVLFFWSNFRPIVFYAPNLAFFLFEPTDSEK